MSHRKLTDGQPTATRSPRGRSPLARGAQALIAGALVAGLALAGAIPANAADGVGGGGVGGGGGSSGPSNDYWLYTGDSQDANGNPQQGWGQTSINTFANAMEQEALWASAMNGRTAMNQACTTAINQAIARSTSGSPRARVVQVGVSVGYTNGTALMGWGGTKSGMQSWYQGLTNSNYWQPMLPGHTSSVTNNVYNTFMANIVETPRIVCVALNESEVQNYTLSISTDKQTPFSVAGTTDAVADRINLVASNAIRENVTARTTLHWAGVEGNAKSVGKNKAIANHGSTNSPTFAPSDFGWSAWPSGKFWFDVSIAKQGKMKAAVSHAGQNDARENWTAGSTAPRKILTSGSPADEVAADEVLASGMFYNAEISARANGYASSMTISDTITTDQVVIGATDVDDASKPYVKGPAGARISGATINIVRSGGSVMVSGTVTNIPVANQALEYTLVVPTYVKPTQSDYTITDSSRVCYTAAQTNCIDGNSKTIRKITGNPDKAWVLDANGALTNAAVDGKTFAPGAGIGAVVNGQIPAKLAEKFSQYSLSDDWSAAAPYVDFSDASKVRVYLDGVNVTGQFTITVSGTRTTAVAKPIFLNATKGLAAAKSVKLYIGGTIRSDFDTAGQTRTFTNSGSQSWNNESVATNSPAIYTTTPAADKVWVLDENGALTASDPGHTNNQGADGKTFAPGTSISAVVNGSVPANLGAALKSYVITDDWAGAANYIDFSDVSKVKVYLDGVNVTSQFTLAISATKTTATAKAAFLGATANRSSEGTVKLVITGTFRDDYDTDGKLEQLTNSGSESWNGKVSEANTPAIYTVTPVADKVWVIDEAGALSASDPAHTGDAGVNGRTFSPGSTISAVVNGGVPANLGKALNSFEIIDDWTGSSAYIDFSDASKTKVFLDGVNVTSQFDVTVQGTKTVATAKAAFLNATKDRARAGVVKLFVTGKFRTDYDTAGELEQLTNAGSQSWNGKKADTNTPAIFTITPNPNKVWVLDEDGALSSTDKNKANDQGVDGKTFAPGTSVSAVVNGSVASDLGRALDSYVITDDWTGSARYIDFTDTSKVKVFLDGANVTSQFTITLDGNKTVATAKASFLAATKGRTEAGEVKLFITGVFRNDYDTSGKLEQLFNAGTESWNGKTVAANAPSLFTVTPKPDKVWVLDEDGALSTSDEDWTDLKGADGKVFLQNDAVAAVVNGSIPADLAVAFTHYSITDDWSGAADYVDFSDGSLAKVFFNGRDVTEAFDVNVVGFKTIATAKPAFLATTVGMAEGAQVKLVISGFFRDDYDTDGQVVMLTNSGSETWNNRTQSSNTPPVYTWTPNPNKQVLGSSEESGDKAHDNINGASVWPGQKLEYSVGIDLRVPAGTARGVKSLVVEDRYDPFFAPDKTSVEFWDSRDPRGPKPIPRSAYKLTFDEAEHTFTATFTDHWLSLNVDDSDANSKWLTQGWLTMRVSGMVSKSIPAGSTVVNQAFQIVNGARTATEIPEVKIPTVTPDKESLRADLIDIDGKVVVEGDVIVYRLLLDGGPARSELAYNVHKFGIVDDFDDEFLDLAASDITVTDKVTGVDVTGKFNVQVKDGVAYVFAKTVDTEGVYGGTIPGDPQPEDLSDFDAAPIRPLEDPIIDQRLLGTKYNVTLRATVKKEQDGHVIENRATQNIQNVHTSTRIVSNPLKDIDPSKDVVVSEETPGESIDGTEVMMNSVFNYRLNSSEIPADRAYGATQWSLTDTFDRVHDQYTGIWAIYANADVYDGSELLFKKGDLLQDSAGHESEPWAGFFKVGFDEDDYTLSVDGQKKYFDLLQKRPDLAGAFSVYVKMLRIAPGEDIANTATESYNGFERDTNTVTTFTNEHPEIVVDKFTLAEGPDAGSHGDVRIAHAMTEDELASSAAAEGEEAVQHGVEVGIHFDNTGDVPLTNVTLIDLTHDGLHGELQGLICAVPADPTAPGFISGGSVQVPDENGMVWVLPSSITELPVAQGVDCIGTLREMAPGMTHGDTVVVTGESVFTGTVVKAEDSWFATAASAPALEVIKYTLDEGREDGDRNEHANALELTAGQAENGVKVAIEVTNAGDEPLTDLSIEDRTRESFIGTIDGLVWLDPVETPAEDGEGDLAEGQLLGSLMAAFDDTEGVADQPAAEDGQETPALDPAPVTLEVAGTEYIVRPLEELTDLEIGETALVVGTLTGMEPGKAHMSDAFATAQGLYSSTPVEGEDPWNAKQAPTPIPAPAPTPSRGAVTGGAIAADDSRAGMLGSASLLMLAAAAVTFVLRRRYRSSV